MGGHGIPVRKTKYFSIDDIPDDLVKQYSKRDPNNPVYKTRAWVNFKKKQILYSQNDGVELHLRTPMRRFCYYGIYGTTFAVLLFNAYTFWRVNNQKKN